VVPPALFARLPPFSERGYSVVAFNAFALHA